MLLSSPTMRTNCRAPRGFKAVKGCSWAKVCDTPQFAQNAKGGIKGAKKRGLLYQEKVVRKLEDRHEDWVGVPELWFKFKDFYGERYAQTDWIGINVELGRIVIVEVKLSRVPNAWWQLNRLYRPLVERIFPYWDIAMVEVVDKVYDVLVPEEVKIVHELEAARINATSLMRIGY